MAYSRPGVYISERLLPAPLSQVVLALTLLVQLLHLLHKAQKQ
jgi:hypothetical protein